jgi:ferredoxin-type protein NapF
LPFARKRLRTKATTGKIVGAADNKFKQQQAVCSSHLGVGPQQWLATGEEESFPVVNLARRGFLRARFSSAAPGAQPSPLRPPWAVAEGDFLDRCTRCGDCIRACAASGSHLLQPGEGGFPVASFNPAACTFCGDCLTACTATRSRALQAEDGVPPWRLQLVIGEDCLPKQQVVCRTCAERCDAGAIRFPPRLGGVAEPVVDADRCTGCGDCLSPCPTQALQLRRVEAVASPESVSPLSPCEAP